MSRRNNILATFERKSPPLDHFISGADEWELVAKAWVSIEPIGIASQRTEFVDTNQIKGTRKSIVKTDWAPDLAQVDSACRMRVDERVFEIEQIVNVGEQNRELQMMVVEKT